MSDLLTIWLCDATDTLLPSLEPEKPSSTVTALASTYSDMIVNYSAVPDFNGPITGYRIYLEFTRNGEKQTLNVTTSRVLTYTVSNLYPYTDYVISYAAINKIGEGPKSAAAAAVKTKEKGKWEIVNKLYLMCVKLSKKLIFETISRTT